MSYLTTTTSGDRQTYWCHECDMSVTLLSAAATTDPLLCPHCNIDYLEEMDAPFLNNPNHQVNPDDTTGNGMIQLQDSYLFEPTANGDDNFLLDSPFFSRLLHQLSNPDNSGSSSSKTSLQSVSTVRISSSMLDTDPIILCAVCKDQFLLDDTAEQLPCNHLYHSDCILPWLSNHNSCPLCRFRLPTVEETEEEDGAWKRTRRMRLSDLAMMEQEGEEGEDWLGIGNTLRHIARRHRMLFPALRHGMSDGNAISGSPAAVVGSSGVDSLTPTQMGMADTGTQAQSTTSVETVSSWSIEGLGEEEMGVSRRGRGIDVSDSAVSQNVLTTLTSLPAPELR